MILNVPCGYYLVDVHFQDLVGWLNKSPLCSNKLQLQVVYLHLLYALNANDSCTYMHEAMLQHPI